MYHATKWGIEGFVESVAQEVASFGIGMTIVEPGGARTEFRYGSAKVAELMPVYGARLTGAGEHDCDATQADRRLSKRRKNSPLRRTSRPGSDPSRQPALPAPVPRVLQARKLRNLGRR